MALRPMVPTMVTCCPCTVTPSVIPPLAAYIGFFCAYKKKLPIVHGNNFRRVKWLQPQPFVGHICSTFGVVILNLVYFSVKYLLLLPKKLSVNRNRGSLQVKKY